MGTPHLIALHRTTPDESGVWRARFAGRLDCSDARRATCRPSLVRSLACVSATCECEASHGEPVSPRCVFARPGGRIAARVIGAAPRQSTARGFWRYDAERSSLRWVAG